MKTDSLVEALVNVTIDLIFIVGCFTLVFTLIVTLLCTITISQLFGVQVDATRLESMWLLTAQIANILALTFGGILTGYAAILCLLKGIGRLMEKQ
jgi:hypothetical protein